MGSAMDSGPAYPTGYQALNQKGNIRPLPAKRKHIPRYHGDLHRSSGTSFKHCFKRLCCFYCCLVSLVIFFFFVGLALYAVYKPEIPSYEVENFNVNAFDLKPGMKLDADFSVKVKAKNPNAHIHIKYENDSSVAVLFRDKTLCWGKLPTFVQPGKDIRDLKVTLKGKSEMGTRLQEDLQKRKHSGKIPLVVAVKAPISAVLGELPLQKLIVSVNCSLIVDKLSVKSGIQILSSDCRYKVTT